MHFVEMNRYIRQLQYWLRPRAGLMVLLIMGLFTSPIAAAAGYRAEAGKLYDAAGNQVQVRGVSHFGFNADILQPQFLWAMGWKEQIAQIKSLGFNAVRVPFVPDTLYVNTPVSQLSYVDANKNPELIGKTPLQVLDLWMAEANRQGLYVMLDFHSVTKYRLYPTWFIDNVNDYWLTYNGQAYSPDDWVRDLKFVAARYAHLPYFFAIDIYNEPNGVVRWSTGDPNSTNTKNHWKPAAEKAAAGILQSNPNLLIFVQGINGNYDGIEDSNIPMNWGESFQQQAYQPLSIPVDKLVLSPHTYGPDVFVKSSFSAPNFPANLPAHWDTLFGRFAGVHPIVIGEWGGRLGQGGVGAQDITWQNAMVDYLLSRNIRSSFYWCYTPNSGDTGGILDDNLNVRTDKIALLQRHWSGTATSTASTLALSASSYSVAQNGGALTVTVNRSGSSASAISVNYATGNGTAISGTHYSASAGTLNWAAGNASPKTFSIPISNSGAFTGSKSFNITLSNASGGATLGTPVIASVSINGTGVASAPASLALSGSSFSVTQNTGTLSLSVKRSGGATGAVSLRYATVNGTARAGSDYTARSGTLSWAANDVSDKSISIPISKAKLFSGTRSFQVQLSQPSSGVSLGSPSVATVTITGSKASAPSGAQPYIQNFSPASGPVGTVVTVNGSGFTGANLAWVGAAHNGQVSVISDTQVRVTIPAGATTGAIAIFNGSKVAFTATSFTVTASQWIYSQPYIQNFSPASGKIGTVVTINGSGLTGANLAWIGAARNGVVSVISDTQVRVTIPAGATSGAIGIFNPSYVAFTATPFTVMP